MNRQEVFWKNYLKEIIKSNIMNKNDIDWGVDAIWEIYSNHKFRITPDEIFRSLIYINKNNILGCFAFTFTDNILDAIEQKDINFLYNTLKSDTPEYISNFLTEEERHSIKEEIEREKIILNRYMEGCTSCNNNIPNDHEEFFKSCINDVCIKTKINPDTMCGKNNSSIWISDYGISFDYKLSELLMRIYNDDINRYTGKKFSETLKTLLKEQYSTCFKFIKIYLDKL